MRYYRETPADLAARVAERLAAPPDAPPPRPAPEVEDWRGFFVGMLNGFAVLLVIAGMAYGMWRTYETLFPPAPAKSASVHKFA